MRLKDLEMLKVIEIRKFMWLLIFCVCVVNVNDNVVK